MATDHDVLIECVRIVDLCNDIPPDLRNKLVEGMVGGFINMSRKAEIQALNSRVAGLTVALNLEFRVDVVTPTVR